MSRYTIFHSAGKIVISGLIGSCCLFLHAQDNKPLTIDSVFNPLKVATPPSDAYIGLSLLDNGEIRHYNYGEQAESGTFCLSSTDDGLTWKKVAVPKEMPFADIQSPVSGEYIRLVYMANMGVYCIRTTGGPDGGRTITRVTDQPAIMIKPPVFIQDGKRIVVAAHISGPNVHPKGSFTYISDDDGISWKKSNIVTAPDHTGGKFHNGIRWNHGAVEPTVIELNDGRLWMIARTAQDNHYSSWSNDGGLTWSASEPSPFYGTITMPTIGRLRDGRILFLWCNTTPLPETGGTNGVWDDVFTNRDAIHAAISEDDGKTWIGMRELYLDPLRNASDYASVAGIDRGVHQSQFIEVKPGKVLVSLGQHKLHRSLVLFDVGWLYEKERFCDFSDSLAQWSSFNYYKGIQGHCGYNRTDGCRLHPHPDKAERNILNIRYTPNDTLVADNEGAVWNFPASRKGEFAVSLRIPKESKEVKLLLNDRWFNPSDTVARYFAMHEIFLSRQSLGINNDDWHRVEVKWDLDKPAAHATVYVDGKRKKKFPLLNKSLHGISYVHFISGNLKDERGIDIEWVKSKSVDNR